MSDTLRVAAVVEGKTDALVLQAILDSILRNTAFEFHTLQPEGSAAFGTSPSSRTGAGWGGVYRWCRQSAAEGDGSVSGSSVLSKHDLLIIQVDADVAGKTYSSASIQDAPSQDLPCIQPCPPPNGTTDKLRTVIIGWLGECQCPSQVVLCTPSLNIEAWVVAAVWPNNPVMIRGNWECRSNPEGQLSALPKRRRFEKSASDYRAKQDEMTRDGRRCRQRSRKPHDFKRSFSRHVHAVNACHHGGDRQLPAVLHRSMTRIAHLNRSLKCLFTSPKSWPR